MNWKTDLRNSYTRVQDLLQALKLKTCEVDTYFPTKNDFPFRVTKAFAGRMKQKDPQDPLLLQVLPTNAEFVHNLNFNNDPVGEIPLEKNSSLLHKYHGRALLITTGSCAINCRYCFRRVFPYQSLIDTNSFSNAIKTITEDTSLKEIILSGGDPLILDDNKLCEILERFNLIAHIERVRIHSRLPIVLPNRITPQFIKLMQNNRFQTCLVVHVNHPNELDTTTVGALRGYKNNGLMLLNQSVLLKNINNNIETLSELSDLLFSAGVLPYYVHLLDRVTGTAHFEVTEDESLQLEAQLRNRLPGYLVPKFVREISGDESKTPIMSL
jgi:L-lysine 2,3-aminomutase